MPRKLQPLSPTTFVRPQWGSQSAQERYDDVAANIFGEVENVRDFELFKRQCFTFVKGGNISKLRELISKWKKSKKEISMDFKDAGTGNTPVILAAIQNNQEILRLLLEQNPDLTLRNSDKKTAVHLANAGLQTLMLSENVPADLKNAAWQGNAGAVRSMLAKECDVNARNIEGLTPLLLATRDINFFESLTIMRNYKPLEVVKMLLQHNANITMNDFDGKTAIHHLVENIGFAARGIVQELVGKVKKLDRQDRNEQSPLHTASKLGDVKIVEMLLSNGASVSCRAADGKTPLHYAVMNGHENVVNLLLKKKADPQLCDDRGDTPLDIAREKKQDRIIKILLDSNHNSASENQRITSRPQMKNIGRQNGIDVNGNNGSPQSYDINETTAITVSLNKTLLTTEKQSSEETKKRSKSVSNAKGFRLPPIEVHAKPSVYSPQMSSSRSLSSRRKKTASLPSSFKLDETEDIVQEIMDTDLKVYSGSLPNSLSTISTLESLCDAQMPLQESDQKEELLHRFIKNAQSSRKSKVFADLFQETSKARRKSSAASSFREDQVIRGRTDSFGGLSVASSRISSTKVGGRRPVKSSRSQMSDNGSESDKTAEKSAALQTVVLQLGSTKEENPEESLLVPRSGRPGTRLIPRPVPPIQEFISNDTEMSYRPKTSQMRNSKAENRSVVNNHHRKASYESEKISDDGHKDTKELFAPCAVDAKRGVNEYANGTESSTVLSAELITNSCGNNENSTNLPILENASNVNDGDLLKNSENDSLVCIVTHETSPTEQDLPTIYNRKEKGNIKEVIHEQNKKFLDAVIEGRKNDNAISDMFEKSDSYEKPRIDRLKIPRLERQLHARKSKEQNRNIKRHVPNWQMKFIQRSRQGTRKSVTNKGRPDKNNKASTKSARQKARPKEHAEGSELMQPSEHVDNTEHLPVPVQSNGSIDKDENGNYEHSRLRDETPKKDNQFGDIVEQKHAAAHIDVLTDTVNNFGLSESENGLDLLGNISNSNNNDTKHEDYSYKQSEVNKRSFYQGQAVEQYADFEIIRKQGFEQSVKRVSNEDIQMAVIRNGMESLNDASSDSEMTEDVEDVPEITPQQVASGGNSPNDFIKEITELVFAPEINKVISAGPSRRVSDCSSAIRSNSIASLVSDDGSEFAEEELQQWSKGRILDGGKYGTVYLGLTSKGKLMAVKQVELNHYQGADEVEKQYKSLQDEIQMLKSLSHRYIVKFIGTAMDANHVNIFMEYIPGGSLQLVLKEFGPLDEKLLRRFTRQIITALAYLHENGVVHRDIKGANIMMTSHGMVKLIDFGCAKRLNINLSHSSQMLHTFIGTPYYMAPEVIRGTGYSFKTDIWSVGCTVFELATGKLPWTGCQYAVMYAIGNNDVEIPRLPNTFSEAAVDFVSSCLTRDPSERLSAKELKNHPFIRRSVGSKVSSFV